MRIAVIGATGNVGTAVLSRLQRAARDREAIQRSGYDTSEDTGGVSIIAVARTVPDTAVEPYTASNGTPSTSGRTRAGKH